MRYVEQQGKGKYGVTYGVCASAAHNVLVLFCRYYYMYVPCSVVGTAASAVYYTVSQSVCHVGRVCFVT